jgi:hypothetical protein
MQLNTLPETPAQAMPALETTEGKQEDMLACALQTKKISFSSRLCLPLPLQVVLLPLPFLLLGNMYLAEVSSPIR